MSTVSPAPDTPPDPSPINGRRPRPFRSSSEPPPPAWTPELASRRAKRLLSVCLPLGLVLAAVFLFWPGLDLAVTEWFYNPSREPAFPLGAQPVLAALVPLTHTLAVVAAGVVLIWFALTWLRPNRFRLQACIVALALLLGPGLMVDTVFKGQWGRARPRDVVQFGGTLQFTPAWVIAGQCPRNCSFVSGHAAGGFAPAVGWFASRRRRWLWIGLAAGAALSWLRISAGAHFLSDTLFAGWTVLVAGAVSALLCVALARWHAARNVPSRPPIP